MTVRAVATTLCTTSLSVRWIRRSSSPGRVGGLRPSTTSPRSPTTPPREANGGGDDYGEFVAVSPDGSKVFVTGRSWDSSTGFDYATVAYEAATGSPLWGRRYGGPGGGRDLPADLAAAPDGTRVYVTGSAFDGSTTGTDYTTVVY